MFSGLLAALMPEEEAGHVLTATGVSKIRATLFDAGLTKAEVKLYPVFILDQRRECLLMCNNMNESRGTK